MILPDREIAERLDAGDLVIDELQDAETQIQPASVDVRLGNEFLVFDRTNLPCIDPRAIDMDAFTEEVVIEDGEQFILHPGDFVLGTTAERVELPPDLLATVNGRSSIGRLAVIVHATAGIIDPGFEGEITLELSNLGTAPVALHPGMRISQLIFMQLMQPAERPYGQERGSKYQGQSGPETFARDPEFVDASDSMSDS